MRDARFREQLQSALAPKYLIERELEGGGMSRVFVAMETRFHRRVVIKVLPPGLAAELSAERFAREIGLAAGLQQANIVAVLTAGDFDGVPWYSMPFVEGETLRSRMDRGAVPTSEAIGILCDVAKALAYAHARGIVHRDIKPENVLLSSGTAVVTDFGIAKAVAASSVAGNATLTATGTLLGTPAYMAPEQVAADPATDHRADLYAWGVMAYELLAGRHPFAHLTSPRQLMTAHFSEAPVPLARLATNAPRSLVELTMRCLMKSPDDRPASAAELLNTLGAATPASRSSLYQPAQTSSRWLVGGALLVVVLGGGFLFRIDTKVTNGTVGTAMSALAVLPFDNVGGDTATRYFADGMTDELATALAHVPGLQVASRTSSYAFRQHDGLDAGAIARRLHVGALVEGAVRRAGGQLRVIAQLTRASDGQTLWAEGFTADSGEVLAVQARLTSAIVTAVAPALAGQPTSGMIATLADAGTRDPMAYDLYLRGRFELNRRGVGVRRSIQLFEEALAHDSTFAHAWAGLASAWAILPGYDASVQSVLPQVQRASMRAMALDSLAGEPYSALGAALLLVGQDARAETLLTRGVELDPRSATARLWLAASYRESGRFDLQERTLRDAMARDPLAGIIISNLARVVALDTGRWGEARALARRAVAMDSNNIGALSNAAHALAMTRDFTESLSLLRRARELGPPTLSHLATLSLILIARNQRDSAATVLATIARLPSSLNVQTFVAAIAAALGQRERAFATADTVIRAGGSFASMVGGAPFVWRDAMGDPRLHALCARSSRRCDGLMALIARTPPLTAALPR